ncbi:stress response protein Nst1p [[Candida] anglica]|uniref:Stress response protein NST1 n=1 Tax=[Candida] anglica TaxID=148631 RepID=A0ABP0E612_9ASCO
MTGMTASTVREDEVPESFTNGKSVHFTYTEPTAEDQYATGPQESSKSKKKKKKKKHSGTGSAAVAGVSGSSSPQIHIPSLQQLSHATLNRPEDDYPTSRVIKQGPNGDVIVESLDDSPLPPPPPPILQHHVDQHKSSYHDGRCNPLGCSHGTPHPNPANIWDNSTLEEQENLKSFWESLDEQSKLELVKIDKDSIMEIFKNESRNAAANSNSTTNVTGNGHHQTHHHHSHGNSHHGHHHNQPHSHNGNPNCSCPFCGRKSNIIEDELESIYDNHFDDIIDFIHEVRDINDLNALPGLLFGGFHMLEEEHKLQRRQQRHGLNQVPSYEEPIIDDDEQRQTHELLHKQQQEEEHQDDYVEVGGEDEDEDEEGDDEVMVVEEEISNDPTKQNVHEQNIEVISKGDIKGVESHQTESKDGEAVNSISNDIPSEESLEKVLDPKLFKALESIDFEKFADDISKSERSADLLEKVSSVRDIIKQLNMAEKVEIEKGIALLKSMGKLFTEPKNNIVPPVTPTDQLSRGLSNFADDLLKNDGRSFIEMMETLSESRSAREDLLRNGHEPIWIDEDDKGQMRELVEDVVKVGTNGDKRPEDGADLEEDEDEEDDDEYDDDDGDNEDDEYEDEDDGDGFEIEEDDGHQEGPSDTESEISEEEKMQEIRRLFLIQVIKLFQERLKNAYKEKLSQDRTRKLIEELEAEENAKKEREMKKLKQKEKAKEKKRLQQLAKEEAQRKKEEEEREREEELKRKQEMLKAEQKKRKEESRLKREEEKKKRIEEAKRKEAEQQKRVEIQRKKEEDARKLKEERKKKAEDARLMKENEKKQKEMLKKQKDEEMKLEQMKAQLEAESILKEQAAVLEKEILQDEPISIDQPVQTPPAQSAPIEDVRSPPAATNHLLEQLYQAKPRASSQVFGGIYDSNIPVMNSPAASHVSNNALLNNTGLTNSGLNGFDHSMSSITAPTSGTSSSTNPSNDFQLFGSTNPMSSFLSSSIPSLDTLGSNTYANTPNMSQQINNWNTPQPAPRNGSIWGSIGDSTAVASPLGSTSNLNSGLWNSSGLSPSTVHQVPTVTSNTSVGPHSTLQTVPTPAVGPPPQSQTPQSHHHHHQNHQAQQAPIPTPLQTPGTRSEIDMIQAGAFQAFQYLQNNQQLEFGVAPSIKLFQTTKSFIGKPGLTLNQFLISCRNSTGMYHFDYIYDDMGTVTHIKVITGGSGISTHPSQQIHSSLQSTHLGTEGMISGFNDLNPFSNSLSGGNRGLWN